MTATVGDHGIRARLHHASDALAPAAVGDYAFELSYTTHSLATVKPAAGDHVFQARLHHASVPVVVVVTPLGRQS
jgi:hypothetical protein